MSDETEVSHFKTELLKELPLLWMRRNYADLLKSDPDRYHEKLGMLYEFVNDLIEQENQPR